MFGINHVRVCFQFIINWTVYRKNKLLLLKCNGEKEEKNE